MFYQKILTKLMPIAILLIGVIQIHSQEIQMPLLPSSAVDSRQILPAVNTVSITRKTVLDDCADQLLVANQRLTKALASLDASDIQIAARDALIVNRNDVIAKQEARFLEVLAILREYATLDNKEKKSFWKKVGERLVKFIDLATDPETIRAILLVITVIKAGK